MHTPLQHSVFAPHTEFAGRQHVPFVPQPRPLQHAVTLVQAPPRGVQQRVASQVRPVQQSPTVEQAPLALLQQRPCVPQVAPLQHGVVALQAVPSEAQHTPLQLPAQH